MILRDVEQYAIYGEAEMICPDCLEEYEFYAFEVDPETLEHRALFECECEDLHLFPEYLARRMITDEDVKAQLRTSRMLYLGLSVSENRSLRAPMEVKMASVNNRSLMRYIEDFSQQSIRNLK